jgi:two-component system sensor histidine kinase BarA
MSYRGIKRVLGETKLEFKCRLLFGTCLLLLITGSFYFYGRQTEGIVYDRAKDKGELVVDTILAMKHWIALERLAAKRSNINIEFADTIVEDMWQRMKENRYLERAIRPSVNIPPPSTTNPSPEIFQPRDDFERQLLAKYEKIGKSRDGTEKDKLYEPRRLPEANRYIYYQPIFASDNCAACHKVMAYMNPNLESGDLMAVMAVEFSDEETQDALSRNRAILYATAIIAVFLAMIALYVVVRYVIVKPLKHLRDVADDVSQGNLDVRAEIHTSDEFEEVAVAFNRMLRHLAAAQQELRTVNQSLDGKVDQLAQVNMRLHEMNRLKSDFLATMSHELRTPLNSIIGFSDVLSTIESLDDRQRRYVKNIQKSGRMLLDMINDILDLAKIESGRMELRLADFHLEAVVAAQCDMARPLAEKKNIDLDVVVDDDLPEMRQDQGKVQQILNNLLSNAIKFTPEGGRIVVSAHKLDAQHASLVVSDTGVGIAPQDQTAIFEKFRQGATVLTGGDAMTREYSGTGLGLSIVKEMCKLLGGEISLVSELGKGSTFSVRLPWRLAERPPLVSPLADDLDELTKPRLVELSRAMEPLLLEAPS